MGRRVRSTRLRWQIVITSYPCPICGAGPGWGCKTEKGRLPKTEPHADRTRLAHGRGWAAADEPPRCVTCTGPLPEDTPDDGPTRCARCRPRMATEDEPGPDGSYDVPLFAPGEDV